jgi:hypothetical protein
MSRASIIAVFAFIAAALTLAGAGQAMVPDVTRSRVLTSSNSQSPENLTPPSITGTAVVGSTLAGDVGSWSGKSLRYVQQWLRCDTTGGSCRAVAYATGITYVVASVDAGSTLRLQVTATNRFGSVVAVSAATAVVPQPSTTPPPPPPPADTTPPSTPGSLVVSPSSTSAALGWTASTDNVGVTGYDVFVNGSKVAAVSTTSTTVASLTCGTSYTLGVDAYDAAGNHSAVSTQSTSTTACPTPPPPPPPPPPSPSPKSIYWGAYINGVQTYSYLYGGTWSNAPWCDPGTQCPLPRFTSNVGKAGSVEHWGMCWTCSFDSGIANTVVARGDIPAVDWANDSSALDADVAAGKYDAQITAVAQSMKAFGHPMFLLFDEEMNGTWYAYSPGANGNTAASFVAMWRHVHDLFVQAGASNVTWVWVPNVDPSGTLTSLASLYPGDAYVDWTGLNGYNWGAAGGGWMTFNQVFSSSYATLLQIAPTKPIMLGEVSSEENGGDKAAWITDMLTTQLPQNYPQVKAMLWFNWRILEKGQYWSWEVESSPASQTAFAQGIASSYYAPGGTFGSLPLLTKVSPLS